MSHHSYVKGFLLSCVLLVWTGLAFASPQQEKKKEATPEGKVNIEEKVNKRTEIVHMVKPAYPAEAKEKGIEGAVKIEVLINKDGEVAEAHAVSGPQELREAALTAVRQWRYKPLGVEAKATIDVNYKLGPCPKEEKPKS
jgi:TonB family protein